MLTLTSRQLGEKLAIWLKSRMAVLLVGPPGTGKTYLSRQVAVRTFGEQLVEVLDGGNESAWKALFPYKTPAGSLELGMALRASGYAIREEGQLVKASPGGALIIDEANRVPPELKSPFQLMASERIVPWPDGGTVGLDIAIVATGNEDDLGVEEASRAELDRYDLVVRLSPTPEEMGEIIASEAGIRPEAAVCIYEAVAKLSGKLDSKKVHKPEGLRMGISVAKLLLSGTLSPADVFRGAAERCWPLGRRGAEKHRPEFDNAVAEVANEFAAKVANLGNISAPVASTAAAPSATVSTLRELLQLLPGLTAPEIVTPALPLPRQFRLSMHVFIACFGMGCAKHLMGRMLAGQMDAERTGVKVHFGENGQGCAADTVQFCGVERHRAEKFCKLILQ